VGSGNVDVGDRVGALGATLIVGRAVEAVRGRPSGVEAHRGRIRVRRRAESTIGSARPGVGCGRVGIGVLLAMA
jgi:hypothetical protein